MLDTASFILLASLIAAGFILLSRLVFRPVIKGYMSLRSERIADYLRMKEQGSLQHDAIASCITIYSLKNGMSTVGSQVFTIPMVTNSEFRRSMNRASGQGKS